MLDRTTTLILSALAIIAGVVLAALGANDTLATVCITAGVTVLVPSGVQTSSKGD